jgi:hypothetical protein
VFSFSEICFINNYRAPVTPAPLEMD